MTMSMRRAFNSRMEARIVRKVSTTGSYDADNVWMPGPLLPDEVFYGVITAGNKYSQLEEGISVKTTEGGERNPDWRMLYVKNRWPILELADIIYFRSTYYKILQHSDEDVFDFHSYIIEKLKNYP